MNILIYLQKSIVHSLVSEQAKIQNLLDETSCKCLFEMNHQTGTWEFYTVYCPIKRNSLKEKHNIYIWAF